MEKLQVEVELKKNRSKEISKAMEKYGEDDFFFNILVQFFAGLELTEGCELLRPAELFFRDLKNQAAQYELETTGSNKKIKIKSKSTESLHNPIWTLEAWYERRLAPFHLGLFCVVPKHLDYEYFVILMVLHWAFLENVKSRLNKEDCINYLYNYGKSEDEVLPEKVKTALTRTKVDIVYLQEKCSVCLENGSYKNIINKITVLNQKPAKSFFSNQPGWENATSPILRELEYS